MRFSALGAHAVVLCTREDKGKEGEKGERRMDSQGRKDSHHLYLPKLFVHFCGCCRMKLQILVIKIMHDAQEKQVR